MRSSPIHRLPVSATPAPRQPAAFPASAATGSPPAAFELPPENVVQKLGLMVLLIFLFFAYSRILDFVLYSLHLPLVLSILALAMAVLSGRFFLPFRTRVGQMLILWSMWMVLGIPFAFWRTGSIAAWLDWSKSLLLFFLIVALVQRTRHVQFAGYAIALAGLAIALLSLRLGASDQFGRLSFSQGILSNSNDLAQILLMSMPFWILFGSSGRGLSFRPFIAGAVLLALLVLVLKTGSRAALAGIGAIGMTIFLSVSITNKIKLVAAGLILLIVAVAVTPRTVRERYATIFSGREELADISENISSAAASKYQRIELLRRSVVLTLQRPLFGVGIKNFQAASANIFSGQTGPAWLETHNSFTQVSSETGIPGFILFVAMQVWCLRHMWRLVRLKVDQTGYSAEAVAHLRLLERVAQSLLLLTIGLNVTGFFSSIPYHIFFPTLFGLCTAFHLSATSELKRMEETAASREEAPEEQPPAPYALQTVPALPSLPRRRPGPLKPRM